LPQFIRGEVEWIVEGKFALRQSIGIPRTTQIGEFIETWENRNQHDDALFQITAIDAFGWELVTLSIWKTKPPPTWQSELYELLPPSIPVLS
jgi:hypothetical protein